EARSSYSVRLAWSDYDNGKWSAKRVTSEAKVLIELMKPEEDRIALNSTIRNGELEIDVRVYTDYQGQAVFWVGGYLTFSGCHGAPDYQPDWIGGWDTDVAVGISEASPPRHTTMKHGRAVETGNTGLPSKLELATSEWSFTDKSVM